MYLTFSAAQIIHATQVRKISERTKKSKPKSEKANEPIKGALKKKITGEQFWLAVLIFGENHAKKHPVAWYVAPHGGGKDTFSRFPFRY